MIDAEGMLTWLRGRRSVRRFSSQSIRRDVLARVVEAATTAPSATNRQPWRFAVVTSNVVKRRIAYAVRDRTRALKQLVAASPHADELEEYGDFFFEPLETAAAIVVPQYREYPDQLAQLLASAGHAGADVETPSSMGVELCATSSAIMLLLLQARAEQLGACWMAGPQLARAEIESMLGIARPYRMLGVVVLGYPDEVPTDPGRRNIERLVTWFGDQEEHEQ